jgi:hypothetical protein
MARNKIQWKDVCQRHAHLWFSCSEVYSFAHIFRFASIPEKRIPWTFRVDFNFRTVHFVPRLWITNKCINFYQFIISLSCSYMFGQLCAIPGEIVCTFWVTCKFGFWLIKFCVVCGCVYAMSMREHRQTDREPPGHQIISTQPHTTQNFINQNPNWHVTQKAQTSSLRMAHSCRNM